MRPYGVNTLGVAIFVFLQLALFIVSEGFHARERILGTCEVLQGPLLEPLFFNLHVYT